VKTELLGEKNAGGGRLPWRAERGRWYDRVLMCHRLVKLPRNLTGRERQPHSADGKEEEGGLFFISLLSSMSVNGPSYAERNRKPITTIGP